MDNQHQLVMGFDFGTQKIGVAIGQSITKTANPIAILKAANGIPDWAKLADLIREWQPTLLVVGLPLNMDSTSNEMCRLAAKFARKLSGRYGLPHEMMDERLTSFEAAVDQGSDVLVDDVAAKLILESWFRQSSGKTIKRQDPNPRDVTTPSG